MVIKSNQEGLLSVTYSLVGRKLGESSLFFRMSLHLLTVSKSRNVSPTENRVAKHWAMSFLVGGPGEPWMCVVSCSTSFFWHPFRSCFCAATNTLSRKRNHSNTNTGRLCSGNCLSASSFKVRLCDNSIIAASLSSIASSSLELELFHSWILSARDDCKTLWEGGGKGG